MIRLGRHIAALTLCAVMPAAAEDEDIHAKLDAWIDDRARIFADVCMGGAPSFRRFGELAAAAGLEPGEGDWRFATDVRVRLQEQNEHCSCIMTMAAVELKRQIAGIILKLHEDRPETAEDPLDIGVYSRLIRREGQMVRVGMETRNFQDVDFIKAFVVAWEPCPT